MADGGNDLGRRRFGVRDLWRLGFWGLCAFGSVSLVVSLALSDAGLERIAIGFANVQGEAQAEARPTPEEEARKVGETVRMLAADRERVLARIQALERSLEDVTGSLASPDKAPAAGWPEPAPTPSASVNVPLPRTVPLPQPTPALPPPNSAVTKTEFGIDLGSAGTVEGLRALWAAARARHGGLLEGLRPVMSVRDGGRPGNVELRLVAGPIPNAASAARLCATLTAAGAVCQPSVFDGQRLALR
jgi:hypothetical protein